MDFDEGILVTKVKCGSAYTLALTNQGKVYSWGLGSSGCLGLGAGMDVKSCPTLIQFDCDQKELLIA